MPAGTSLGEGIGLQSKPYDNRWLERIASDRSKEDAARAKGEKELFKDSDFVATKGNFLPPYQKAIVALEKDMMNKIAQTRQGGRYVNQAQARQIMYDYKNQINQYVVNNDLAKKYLERKDIMHDQEVLRALTSTDSDITTIAELTQTNPFVRVGADGAFNYYPVPNKQVKVEFDAPGIKEVEDYKRVGRTTYRREKLDYTPDQLAQASAKLTSDPNWALQAMARGYQTDPETFSKQPNETHEQYFQRVSTVIAGMADEEVNKLRPPVTYGKVFTELAPAPSGGSGASKEKYKAPVQENVKATIWSGETEQGEEKTQFDPKTNKQVPTGQYEQKRVYKETTRPLYQALNPNMKAFTIPSSEGIIDANTNQYLPKASYNLTIKPDGLTTVKVKKDGVYKKYVLGTVVRPLSTGGESESEFEYTSSDGKTEKTSKLLIPYEESGISSAIEANNDLTEFDVKFNSLKSSKPASSTKASSGGGSYLIKGKKYSEKQLLDMGYSVEQIAPYKQ